MAASRFHISLPTPATARGSDPDLSFTANGADEFAAQLQRALQDASLFERWRGKQEDPDEVDASLGATDPSATVAGTQEDLLIKLVARTSLPHSIVRQRMDWLAGRGWELRDVSAG